MAHQQSAVRSDGNRQDLPASASDYLLVPEVADHYRTTAATVRYWRHIGYGPRGVKLGTRVLYPRAEIERFDRDLAARAADSSGAA